MNIDSQGTSELIIWFFFLEYFLKINNIYWKYLTKILDICLMNWVMMMKSTQKKFKVIGMANKFEWKLKSWKSHRIHIHRKLSYLTNTFALKNLNGLFISPTCLMAFAIRAIFYIVCCNCCFSFSYTLICRYECMIWPIDEWIEQVFLQSLLFFFSPCSAHLNDVIG